MHYLLDQGLPRSTVECLRELGIVSQHVGELGLSSATDVMILEEGRKLGSVVVTLDSDFHALLALSNAISPSVIRIRIEGMKGPQVANVIYQVASVAESELTAGAAITVTDRKIAIRRLPILGQESRDEINESGESS